MQSFTPPPPGPDDHPIFISYRRQESLETVGRIYSWLIARLPSNLVFLDLRAIAGGTAYPEVINHALEQAVAVLVVVGGQWLTVTDANGNPRISDPTDVHRAEIETALRYKKPIIPLLIQGAIMPGKASLPASLAPIADLQAITIRSEPDFDNDMRQVRAALLRFAPLPFSAPTFPTQQPAAQTNDGWLGKFFRRRG